MIQFNLLPDIKIEYLKAQRTKRFVFFIAAAVSAATFAIFVLLFLNVYVAQRVHIGNLNSDIIEDSERLKNTKDLDKVLTIQNQLNSLPGLHDQKPVATRLFGYLSEITPNQITISKLDVNFAEGTMHFEGASNALSTVNQFADTLKFTKYTTSDGDTNNDPKSSFSEVVLTSFGRTDKEATYQIDMKFDPAIFDSTNNIKLVVPQIVTTRSTTEKPGILFQEQTPKDNSGGTR